MSTEGLFRIGGTHNRIQELAAKATAGDVEFDPHEVPHNVSALVTKYLRELPEPLLTAAAYDSYITAIGAPSFIASLHCHCVFCVCVCVFGSVVGSVFVCCSDVCVDVCSCVFVLCKQCV